MRKLAIVIVASVFLSCAPAVMATVVQSTFDTGTDGWTFFGDQDSLFYWDSDNQWLTTEDNGGGGNVSTYLAPAKFLGNKLSFYGGNLHLTIRAWNGVPADYIPDYSDIIVWKTGYGADMSYFFTPEPSNDAGWLTFDVPLTEAGWYNSRGNKSDLAPADYGSFTNILGSIASIEIRGEYYFSNQDKSSLDTVIMSSEGAGVPEPQTLALLAAGGLALAALRRRRRAS